MTLIVCVTTHFKNIGEALNMELTKNNVVNLPNKSNAPTAKAPMPQSVCGGLKTPYLVLMMANTLSEQVSQASWVNREPARDE